MPPDSSDKDIREQLDLLVGPCRTSALVITENDQESSVSQHVCVRRTGPELTYVQFACALNLASGIVPYYFWIPTELMPMDRDSRNFQPRALKGAGASLLSLSRALAFSLPCGIRRTAGPRRASASYSYPCNM